MEATVPLAVGAGHDKQGGVARYAAAILERTEGRGGTVKDGE